MGILRDSSSSTPTGASEAGADPSAPVCALGQLPLAGEVWAGLRAGVPPADCAKIFYSVTFSSMLDSYYMKG